jgi:hypothetical protein
MSTSAEDRSPGQVLCSSLGTPQAGQGRHRLVVHFAAEEGRQGIVQIRHHDAPADVLG